MTRTEAFNIIKQALSDETGEKDKQKNEALFLLISGVLDDIEVIAKAARKNIYNL